MIQQLHSIVSPALDMTFPEMKMEIWDLESGLPGCLHVNKVQSSKSMANLRPSSNLVSQCTEEMWAEINAGRIRKAYCCCLYVYYHLHKSHITYSLSKLERRYVECKRKILKHQDVSDWLCPPGCKKADIIAVGLQEMVSLNTFNVAVRMVLLKGSTEMGSSLGDKIGFNGVRRLCYITHSLTH